jgi:hypothetical protein
VSTISNWRLAWRLFRRVLDRWNSRQAFVAGLLPLWVALALFPNYQQCRNDECWYLWRQGNPIDNGLAAVPSMAGLILLTLAAAWIGVWLGAGRRRPAATASCAFGLILILTIASVHIDDVFGGFGPDPFNPVVLPREAARDLAIYIVLPLIMLAGMPFLAQHTARKPQ